MPLLKVDALSKSYRKRPILRGIQLEVGAGEAVAVIGTNGAGKSTLLGCLTGERVPDSGSVHICGHDPFTERVAAAECLGFVPEHPFLYGELTVLETLRFVAEVRGLEPAAAEAEYRRLLTVLGLEGAEGALCRELSQGMGRKVAIVVALLHRPRLLVLDEVFNGLDRPSTMNLLDELDRHREGGGAIVLSSHDLHLLAERCNRGLLLAPKGWRSLEGSDWTAWRSSPSLDAAGIAPPLREDSR